VTLTAGSSYYSEYYLYWPILEIASAQGWSVSCQYPLKASTPGRPRAIDFVFESENQMVGLEVKWAGTNRRKLDLGKEIEKFNELTQRHPNREVSKFLIIFGLATLFDQKNLGSNCLHLG